ncbi:glutamate receptor ionotropic, kainate 2-like [Oratosquilla oratoria]|uniref:glutamate receptor ionotropic, kainate 2-like n=1 Tax=Oratosquilla oratoria TaxID=337810 RepID=UPI003F757BAE
MDQIFRYTFNQFRSIVIQGNLIQPSRVAPRIVTLAWYFFCLNIYIVYSGSLTSFLTLPSFEKPIDSLLDLYNFLQERDIQFMFLEDTTYEYMFTYAHADSGIYAKLGAMATEESYTPEEELTIRRIREGEDIAYVSDYFTVQITTSLLGSSRFHIARQTFSPQPFAITLYNGCPYVPNFNKQLLRLQEFGLPHKWLKDGIKGAEFQGWKNNRGAISDSRGLLPILSLKHLQSALIMYAVGMILALLVFLVELCSHVAKHE